MADQAEHTPDPLRAVLDRMRDLRPQRWEYAALLGWVAGSNPELVQDALTAMERRRTEREMEAVA